MAMSSTKDIINQELDDLWAEEAEARLDAYECGDLEARVMSYPRNRDDAPPVYRRQPVPAKHVYMDTVYPLIFSHD